MRTRLFLSFSLTLSFAGFSQTEVDLYRYSNTFNEGSARFEAMGGSFGALGAEMGAARINPAGFARYSSSQFAFGLSSISLTNKSTFQSTDLRSTDYKMRLSNLGLVLASDLSEGRSGFLYQQIGIGYNSVANFGNEIKYTGQQFESLLDGFAAQAYGTPATDLGANYPFSSSVAYETYAINPDPNDQYGYVPALGNTDVIHTRTVTSKGGIGELFFSYSANYLNKLYIGANVGVQFLRYTENMTHHEDVVTVSAPDSLQSFDYQYNLKTKGNGTNLKIGVIYLPVEAVRLGLALHTPTFFELTDNWNANMTTQFTNSSMSLPIDPPTGNYKYRMRTPARIIGSFAYVFGTRGCINIDAEYLDYRWANFKSTTDQNYSSYDYKAENAAADARFKSVVNLRAGGELVFNTNFFLRAGLGLFPKGDKNLEAFGGKFDKSYSGGFGFRFNKWTIDAAVKSLNQTRNYVAFEGTSADIKTNALYIAVNFQVKF